MSQDNPDTFRSEPSLALSRGRQIKQQLSAPILASLLSHRRETIWLLAAGVLHVGLIAAGLSGWVCPFKAVTGIPCPGCGLGRAAALFLRGDWRAAMTVHAFAPVLIFVVGLITVVTVLPTPLHQRAVQVVAAVERRTMVTALLMAGLFIYWGLRLVWFGIG